VLASLLLANAPAARADALRDSVAAEIGRWSTFVSRHPPGDDDWKQVKGVAEPVLARARQALAAGRPLYALNRLAAARTYLAASAYVEGLSAGGPIDSARFEAEWARMGATLGEGLRAPAPGAMAGIAPAALRALAEAALPQERILYEASLDYGRNTEPQYGVFYLGQAQSQKDFIAMARSLATPAGATEPPARDIEGELDSLETEVLAAYRPPASLDHHPEFIAVSAALKEARELDAAGLRLGALLRYLQAALRFDPLRAGAPPLDAPALRARLRELDERLSSGETDHSLGRMLLEIAQTESDAAGPDSVAPAAAAIATDVLPRYFAALGPAPPRAASPPARATVTLVRWPYT
jgi:hypothetical protein